MPAESLNLQKIGIKTVAICSDPDVNSPHVNLADEFVNIRGNTSTESYLVVIDKIIKAVENSNTESQFTRLRISV